MAIQISTDTELSAVNSILGSIGQSPITSLTTGNALQNPEIALVVNLLTEANKDVQTMGWHFNTEYRVLKSPDNNKHFSVPVNAILYDISDGQSDKTSDVVKRNGKLYDVIRQSYEFDGDRYIDSVLLINFDDVPAAVQRYIISRAAVRAATQLVSNADLVKLLKVEEEQTRASAIEYETQQGDHNFFGFPQDSTYNAYKPFKALAR